jgi:hypothetical protein
MTRLFALAGAIGLLLGSAPAFAANGDDCGSTQFTKTTTGRLTPVWCKKVLDDVTSASGGPVELDFTGLATSTAATQIKRGIPDAIVFKVGFTDCTAGTVTIRSKEVSGGSFEDLLAASTDLDVDATAPAGNTIVRVNTHDIPIGQIIGFSWSAGAGCSTGFDILAIGYEVAR